MNRMIITALALSACVVGGGEGALIVEDPAGVRLDLGNGEAEILSRSDRVDGEVRWEGGGVGRAARPEVWVDDDGWMVVEAGGALGGAELGVRLPPGVPVIATVDRGDLTIGLEAAADVDACVAAGALQIEVPTGSYALQLDAAAGDLSMAGVVDDPEAEHFIHACVAAGELEITGVEEPALED